MPRISTDNYQTVASWNGSQDLFVVEQPDGTKVATPAMVKQYVLGDMDNVPTQNSNNPVKSGGTKTYVDNAVSTALDGCRIAVFEQTFIGVDITTAWGSLYESATTLQIDISSLGLQTVPKMSLVSIKTAWAEFLITPGTSTTTAISFRPIRPTVATGVKIVATALVIY